VIKRNMLHMLQRNRAARELLAPIYRRNALNSYLSRGQLFAGLPPAQGRRCIDFLTGRTDVEFLQVDPGQAVFLEGAPADRFYIIYRGHVSVSEAVGPGGSRVRAYLGMGQQFGEIGLLTDPAVSPAVAQGVPPEGQGRRTGTCTALDHVELVAIPRSAFLRLLTVVPEVRQQLEQAALRMIA